MAGRRGPRSGGEEDLKYRGLDDKVDEGPWREGPLIVAWGAEEIYKTTQKSGAIGQKGHSVCPWFMKKRWYDISGTQVSIDVRGVWPSDVKTRAASPPGNPLCVYGAWKAARDQEEFPAAFVMLCGILDTLLHVEGRSVLQIICSHGRNRSATLGVALSAVYDIPIWLPTFGDLHTEWWAIARLPDEDIEDLKVVRVLRRAKMRGQEMWGQAYMPSLGNPVVDAVRFDVWKVAPSVLLELDGENDADLRTYRNPSAAITSACRKEMDRLRPEVPASQGRSDGGGGCRSDVPHPRQPPRPTYDDYDARRAEPRGGAFYEDRR
ncbi:unnamed protein product, partial [Symbiodinium sp. CCMP2456]